MDKKKIILIIKLLFITLFIVGLFYYFIIPNLNLINVNSGAFSVIFSGLVAVATIAYVFLTWKLVTINEEFRNPNVIVDFEPSSKWINFVYIIIKNIGVEPAYNIKFEITPDFQYSKGKYLSKLNYMKGIKYLSPNREVKSFLMSMAEKNEGKMNPFNIKATFENKKGKKLEGNYEFDFSQWLDISQLGDDPMEVISKSIKEIDIKLEKVIGKTGDKIKTEIYTQEDIKKKREDERKKYEKFLGKNK